MFENCTIIGCGLMGASLAKAVRRNHIVQRINVVDKNKEVRDAVLKNKWADAVYENIKDAVTDTQLVIVATPLSAMHNVANELCAAIGADTLVTDVGSVKQGVAALFEKLPASCHFIPSHPITGSERAGPDAGQGRMFFNRTCIITDDQQNHQASFEQIKRFWQALGMKIYVMSANRHDALMALTSHLPNLLSFSMVATFSKVVEEFANGNEHDFSLEDAVLLSAGSFKDSTRVAASDSLIWRDIFIKNKDELLSRLSSYKKQLAALEDAIASEDGEKLLTLLQGIRKQKNLIDAKVAKSEIEASKTRKTVRRPYETD